MGLIKGNTKWILFLSTSNEPDERHVHDLAYGLLCLEVAGVQEENISIYIDGKNRQWLAQLIASGSAKSHVIKESKDFSVDQANNIHENIVMFITGHGGIEGIDAPTPITPYNLLQQIKGSPNLKQAILYLGQCHAGIFNYIGAGRRAFPSDNPDPEIIIIGATSLHNSLSSPTKEHFVTGEINWVANLFLLYAFKWISKPVDVDGDGKITVIDSYKYASAVSNIANKNAKIQTFVTALDLHQKWIAFRAAVQQNPTDLNKLNFEAASTQLEAALDIQFNHQECWILNAIPAQSIEF